MNILTGSGWFISKEDCSNWKFPWLINEFPDIKWTIKTEDKPITIDFDDYIPSTGEHLSHPKFSQQINVIKKVISLKRTGFIATDNPDSTLMTRANSMYYLTRSLKLIAKFLIKEYGSDLFAKNGFNLLQQIDVDKFINEIALGRANLASGLTDRIDKILESLGDSIPENIIIPKNDGFIINSHLLSQLSSIPVKELSYLSVVTKNKFLDKFNETHGITLKDKNNYEYPNLCPPHINTDEDTIGDTTLQTLIQGINALNDYQGFLPELCDYSLPEINISKKTREHLISTKTRTPNIPTTTALCYLNEAIKLIHVYGKDISETKCDCDKQLQHLHKKGSARRDHLVNKIVIPKNKFTEDYNVTRYNELPTGSTTKEKRENVTVEYAFKMLQAATYILTGTFCVKRIDEVITLYEESCALGLWGGFEILFGIEKSSPTEKLLITGRPVPNLVADAFEFISNCNKHTIAPSESFPYIFQAKPRTDSNGKKSENKSMTQESMRNMLCEFADFVEIPTERINGTEYRWYLRRTHVLRRFGAKAYFSTNNLSDLPALTWLMGHRSSKETWQYILEEVDGLDITDEQAQSITEAIFNSDIDTSEIEEILTRNTQIKIDISSSNAIKKFLSQSLDSGMEIYSITNQKTGKIIFYWQDNHEQS